MRKIILPDGFLLTHTSFTKCSALKEIIFPANLPPSPGALYATFEDCVSLKVIDFPESFTGTIESSTFTRVTATLIFRSSTVVKYKSIYGWNFQYAGKHIYVPDVLVDDYKIADGWKDQKNCIKPLSKYQG